MKKLSFILFISILNLSFSQNQTKISTLSNEKEVGIRIQSDKDIYHIGDTIRLKIIFYNNKKEDLLIAFRKGYYHFSQLEFYQNGIRLKPVGMCREKTAPLGFLESDFHKLKSNSTTEFELIVETANFPTKKNCFELNQSGYGILSHLYGVSFDTFGEINLNLKYDEVRFPNKNESIHSAYHTKTNVWNELLISNAINIKIEN
jgi:predicted DNA-binding protein (MmcQ/YjbR family)